MPKDTPEMTDEELLSALEEDRPLMTCLADLIEVLEDNYDELTDR